MFMFCACPSGVFTPLAAANGREAKRPPSRFQERVVSDWSAVDPSAKVSRRRRRRCGIIDAHTAGLQVW